MSKKIRPRPFAPNGLLTENQSRQLVAWYEGDERLCNQREISQIIGVSRMKLHTTFAENPERPFDELKLKNVNKLIELYNQDLEKQKEKLVVIEETKKETKKTINRAKKLIQKVDE
ncbi:hypothetical protein [Listeria booriae]|uniref:hypothetical protein n=1 Tax=Listeria booriae TaxID=1552123 RepID=UPI001624271E|nr:hypothetical protein [Listeria booriae]MBC2173995.1 hypothetical protein [Listeria booriae]